MINMKSNKGNTGVDIIISLGIIVVTLTVLISLYFSLYISNIEIERRTQAISYGTQILEKVSEYYYSDVTNENFEQSTLPNGRKQIAGIEISNGYDVSVNVSNYTYNDISDVLKKVEVTIRYKISNKQHTLTLSKNKTKERLVVPNLPELPQELVPVKVQKENNKSIYKLTSTTDSSWYNYNNKLWALAIEKTKSEASITTEDLYVWIPRYAYNSTTSEIKFLYSDKNRTVNSSGDLEYIETSYVVDNKFTNDDSRGYWIKVSDIRTDETASRLNNSEYGKLIY